MNKENYKDMAVISEKVSKIEAWVNNADINHFPSIEKRFDKIETKMAYYSGGIVAIVSVIQLILKWL